MGKDIGHGIYLCCSGERAPESSRKQIKAVFEVYKAANALTKERNEHWFRPIHHLFLEDVKIDFTTWLTNKQYFVL